MVMNCKLETRGESGGHVSAGGDVAVYRYCDVQRVWCELEMGRECKWVNPNERVVKCKWEEVKCR
jgi:hypothetical protein